MTDILTREKRSWSMSIIEGKDTKPDITLRYLFTKVRLKASFT